VDIPVIKYGMKILVFEYITGGGFNKQELPQSLKNEGRLMLQALLDNLRLQASYKGLSIIVMLDYRFEGLINTDGFETIIIKPEQNSYEQFVSLIQECDAVWPIAPEYDGVLQKVCQAVELLGKKLLSSSADGVALTGNKFTTYLRLKEHGITTVPTRLFVKVDSNSNPDALNIEQELVELCRPNLIDKVDQWLVKPVDGVGCSENYILSDQQDFDQMHLRQGHYIIQPHLQGKKTSLSCLFKEGRSWLLCANLQQFNIIDQQYELSEIIVNYDVELSSYQDLVSKIAQAFPELWGYIGIDLIETSEQIFVLEINPRLTTSFVGINEALGINVAENVLQLVKGLPIIKPLYNQAINIKVKHDDTN
jgi:predicted ATP-grasp superfamily ATP-dependent carboligase